MKEKIIVLRTIKYSEADLIVHGLNPSGGRMAFLARGALKSKKRFSGGVLEPTHYILATYQPGRPQSEGDVLHTLQEATLLKGFNGLRERYERLEAALYFIDVVGKVSQHGVEDAPEIFDLLGNALFAAENSQRLDLLRLQFDAKLLYLQGVLPPDPNLAAVLRPPLKEHETLSHLSGGDQNRMQAEMKSNLQRYLQGLTPLGGEFTNLAGR